MAEKPLDIVLSRLNKVKKQQSGFVACCPAHDDHRQSLSVYGADDGRVLIHCHAGCEIGDILGNLGLEAKDLFMDTGRTTNDDTITYDYTDADGKLVYQVVRKIGKRFVQRRPDGAGGWTYNLRGVSRVPYRLPEVLKAIERGETIFINEGEKDVEKLRALGLVATTNSGGAGKWTSDLSSYFKGASVVLVPDNDKAGMDHANDVASKLEGIAESVKIVELPGLAEKEDVSDWIASGGTKEELATLAAASVNTPAVDLSELLETVRAFISDYVVFTNIEQANAVTLWVAHTHTVKAFEVTPYLCVTSPEARCGKTRLLEVLELLVASPMRASNVSDAALFRSVDSSQPTVLFDEVDAVFSAKAAREDMRSLLNAGYRKGAKVFRCEAEGKKQAVREYDAFSAKVLAAIGSLPETIEDRSIPIRLRRKSQEELTKRYRQRLAKKAAAPICRALEAWGKDATATLMDSWPDLPKELNDRAQDGWEPLLAIADAAGGPWPKTGRGAAVRLHNEISGDVSDGILLLEHIQVIFGDTDRLSSAELLNRLVDMEEGPWGEWWGASVERGEIKSPASRLARLLKPFAIMPKKLRLGGELARGYERLQFEDAWRRYLMPSGAPIAKKDGTNVTLQVDGQIKDGTEENSNEEKTDHDQQRSNVPSLESKQTAVQENDTASDTLQTDYAIIEKDSGQEIADYWQGRTWKPPDEKLQQRISEASYRIEQAKDDGQITLAAFKGLCRSYVYLNTTALDAR